MYEFLVIYCTSFQHFWEFEGQVQGPYLNKYEKNVALEPKLKEVFVDHMDWLEEYSVIPYNLRPTGLRS